LPSGRNRFLDRDFGDAAGGEAETLAPADDTVIGRHLDEQRLHLRPLRGGGVLGGIAEIVRHADVERLDGGDFHRLNFLPGWCGRARGYRALTLIVWLGDDRLFDANAASVAPLSETPPLRSKSAIVSSIWKFNRRI
jgi:hypothetical protein